MKNHDVPKMIVEREIGDILIQFNDSSLHFFIPEDLDFFEINREELSKFIEDIQSLLGEVEKEKKDVKVEGKGFGEYTVDSTLYLSKEYRLNHLQDEIYIGASGGTDQIILELISVGFATGIGAELSRRLFELILSNTKYSNQVHSKEEIYSKVKKLLYKQYGAAGEITFKKLEEKDDFFELAAIDSRGKVFEIKINVKSGLPSILVKN
jgi:hypothetical protein